MQKMNSKNTIDYNLQSYIQKLQSFRILIMGDNYIDSSKIDKYLKTHNKSLNYAGFSKTHNKALGINQDDILLISRQL